MKRTASQALEKELATWAPTEANRLGRLGMTPDSVPEAVKESLLQFIEATGLKSREGLRGILAQPDDWQAFTSAFEKAIGAALLGERGGLRVALLAAASPVSGEPPQGMVVGGVPIKTEPKARVTGKTRVYEHGEVIAELRGDRAPATWTNPSNGDQQWVPLRYPAVTKLTGKAKVRELFEKGLTLALGDDGDWELVSPPKEPGGLPDWTDQGRELGVAWYGQYVVTLVAQPQHPVTVPVHYGTANTELKIQLQGWEAAKLSLFRILFSVFDPWSRAKSAFGGRTGTVL